MTSKKKKRPQQLSIRSKIFINRTNTETLLSEEKKVILYHVQHIR